MVALSVYRWWIMTLSKSKKMTPIGREWTRVTKHSDVPKKAAACWFWWNLEDCLQITGRSMMQGCSTVMCNDICTHHTHTHTRYGQITASHSQQWMKHFIAHKCPQTKVKALNYCLSKPMSVFTVSCVKWLKRVWRDPQNSQESKNNKKTTTQPGLKQ